MAPTAFATIDTAFVMQSIDAPLQQLEQNSRDQLLRRQQQERQPEGEAKPGFDQGYGK